MTINNSKILADVEAGLSTTQGRFPREVRDAIGGNDCEHAPSTVRHALAALEKQGRATFEGPNTKRRYRRADPQRLAETRRVHEVAAQSEET